LNDNVALAIPLAALVAYVPFTIKLGVLLFKQGPLDYNNESPRDTDFEKALKGDRETASMLRRCVAAHANGFEALSYFGPAVAFAVARGVPDATIAHLASNFILTRCAYNVAYVGGVNQPISYIRTTLFFGGVYWCLKIFAAAAKN
jgi:uncharacterized MAPEG superfamily protein